MKELQLILSGSTEQERLALLSENEASAEYGLTLTPKEAEEVALANRGALAAQGRVQFGEPATLLLARKFRSSPYINKRDYAQTLIELTEIFYRSRNETNDLLSDEQLADFMRDAFDTECGGSLELLESRELGWLERGMRVGFEVIVEETEEQDE